MWSSSEGTNSKPYLQLNHCKIVSTQAWAMCSVPHLLVRHRSPFLTICKKNVWNRIFTSLPGWCIIFSMSGYIEFFDTMYLIFPILMFVLIWKILWRTMPKASSDWDTSLTWGHAISEDDRNTKLWRQIGIVNIGG